MRDSLQNRVRAPCGETVCICSQFIIVDHSIVYAFTGHMNRSEPNCFGIHRCGVGTRHGLVALSAYATCVHSLGVSVGFSVVTAVVLVLLFGCSRLCVMLFRCGG